MGTCVGITAEDFSQKIHIILSLWYQREIGQNFRPLAISKKICSCTTSLLPICNSNMASRHTHTNTHDCLPGQSNLQKCVSSWTVGHKHIRMMYTSDIMWTAAIWLANSSFDSWCFDWMCMKSAITSRPFCNHLSVTPGITDQVIRVYLPQSDVI
jgi:hypothetical protein